jgi:hypothetical protein
VNLVIERGCSFVCELVDNLSDAGIQLDQTPKWEGTRMNDSESISEWPTYSDAARTQRQALRARKQEELPGKAMSITILVGLIMVFVGAAYALYSATRIVAWMVS